MTSLSGTMDDAMRTTAAPETYDVIILGGGVNGAGLFRDLSLNGLSCLIVDRFDFGSGTSAAPSRLIHGGIKYLETGELRLVAQSTLERNLLLRNAPHCVEPLETFIPAFSWVKGAWAALRTLAGSTTAPRSRGALLIKVGMLMYDVYGARRRVMPKHRFLSRKGALRLLPQLTPRIVAGGLYYDAKVSRPERLVYELVKDGVEAGSGSWACNHTELLGQSEGVLDFRRPDGRQFQARAPLVFNAAGPWIDRVNAILGETTAMIGGTKGSHILLDHPALVKGLDGRMIYFEADDGRICLVFEYLGLALVGSTDIKASNPESVRCEDDEISYFLASLRSLLPGFRFERDQIVYTYSGIRPLPASNVDQPGLISRDHSAPVLEETEARPFPIISLVGGKWTTFRGFAEEAADMALRRLSRPRRISTENSPIGGGRNLPVTPGEKMAWIERVCGESRLPRPRVAALLARYGSTAEPIAIHVSAYSDDRPLAGCPSYSTGEIDWLARSELVIHLSDIIMRRTTMAIENTLTMATIEDVAAVAGNVLDWDWARRRAEITALLQTLTESHGMKIRS
jgi:glycerol-3-phosphate dehydrogenase